MNPDRLTNHPKYPNGRQFRVADVVEDLGISKTVAYNLLRDLEHSGRLREVPQTAGAKVYELRTTQWSAMPFRKNPQPLHTPPLEWGLPACERNYRSSGWRPDPDEEPEPVEEKPPSLDRIFQGLKFGEAAA